MGEFPEGLSHWAEWRRVVYAPNGERWEKLDSSWYTDERAARVLLNEEYPEPNPNGFTYKMQKRWVTSVITIQD